MRCRRKEALFDHVPFKYKISGQQSDIVDENGQFYASSEGFMGGSRKFAFGRNAFSPFARCEPWWRSERFHTIDDHPTKRSAFSKTNQLASQHITMRKIIVTAFFWSVSEYVLGFVPSVGSCYRRVLLDAATLTNTKEEKITKELQQLMDVLEQKELSSGGPLLVAQTAPSVRVAFSEAFDLPPNSYTPGHLVATLKALGFDLVLDTNTGADLTICEEATELLHRLQDKQQEKESMPLFTSCCPGWLNFVAKAEPGTYLD